MPTATLPYRAPLLLLGGALAIACNAISAPRIPPLKIAIEPASASLQPGEAIVLAAHASGGEAIRLIVDWSIDEGSAGGRLESLGERANGEESARYTAPMNANGNYHVSVQLRGFPAVRASTVISVGEKRPADTRQQ